MVKTKKMRVRKRKTKGGTILPVTTPLINPQWRSRPTGQYWATVIHIDDTDIFGSSIPHQNDLSCFQTFAFYMYRLEIRRIISLHACALRWQDDYCNPQFYDMENRIWDALQVLDVTEMRSNLLYHPQYAFEDVPIYDMTSGPINSWLHLNQVRFNSPDDRTLIHCAGGYGRTCSALFMLSWKRKYSRYPGYPNAPFVNWPTYEDPARLGQNFLGFNDSADLYNGFLRHFDGRIHVYDNPINVPYQNRINLMGNAVPSTVANPQSNIGAMRDEAFCIQNDYYANLFIQRVNRMIMCWAMDHTAVLTPPGSLHPIVCLFAQHPDRADDSIPYTPATIFPSGSIVQMINSQAGALQLQYQQFYGHQYQPGNPATHIV
jgi:hypothetical protein